MVLYSDFATPTLSTTADTAATTANITYNGVGGQVYFLWACGGAHTDTAAKAIMPYALFTGTGVPGVQPQFPLGRWRSAELIGASVGSVSADPTAIPVSWTAPANGVVTIDVRNAGSSTAPDILVGIIYGSGANFSLTEAQMADPWNLRSVPKTAITAILADNHGTTETSVGAMTIPADYPNVVGLGTYVATNGVRVTAESLIGTCRYTATGAGTLQFEPSQKWPFFGQQMAPAGTDIQEESFAPTQLVHPLAFKASPNSTITSLGTLKNALTNAVRWQSFAYLA